MVAQADGGQQGERGQRQRGDPRTPDGLPRDRQGERGDDEGEQVPVVEQPQQRHQQELAQEDPGEERFRRPAGAAAPER